MPSGPAMLAAGLSGAVQRLQPLPPSAMPLLGLLQRCLQQAREGQPPAAGAEVAEGAQDCALAELTALLRCCGCALGRMTWGAFAERDPWQSGIQG
jgi:hypothetical protein